MTNIEINELIQQFTGQPVELKDVNDTLYIKFDYLPYSLRSHVHSQPDYDETRMIHIERDCGCGHAYFLDASHFYNLLKNYQPA